MEQLPCEIIQKIALFCIKKEDLTIDREFYMKLHVLTPDFISKYSFKHILNFSMSSKAIYDMLWNSSRFWKDIFKEQFNTLSEYIIDNNHMSIIKQALTRGEHQCKKCKYFCTVETDRLICLIDSKLIIYIYCEICHEEHKIVIL
jgi:hypothetical protein